MPTSWGICEDYQNVLDCAWTSARHVANSRLHWYHEPPCLGATGGTVPTALFSVAAARLHGSPAGWEALLQS